MSIATLSRVRLLLLSTYELGHQPLGIAGPAALLEAAGHTVRSCDLSVETIASGDVAWADGLVCSVPMHTALRLTTEALGPLRERRPELRVALHGLYARVGAPQLRDGDLAISGEVDHELLAWVETLDRPRRGQGGGPSVRVDIGRPDQRVAPDPSAATAAASAAATRAQTTTPTVTALRAAASHGGRPARPDRSSLPPLDRYARLVTGDGERLVGSVEATRGCSHHCRHCPVPTVYDGRTRAVAMDEILADVAQLVGMGAGHIHFADPDFLNRPQHALRVAAALHERFPALSFDATIKVSHVLGHRDTIAALGAAGCIFAVSAFESTSALVLERLDKGHTLADAAEAVAVLRAAGIEPRPSFLPFTPWTSLEDLVALLDFVAAHDLVRNVEPVQYGIRLLVPPGSLLLRAPDPVLTSRMSHFDPSTQGWSWTSADHRLDELQRDVAMRSEDGAALAEPAETTYAAIRALVFAAIGRRDPGPPPVASQALAAVTPHLTESWFCCAEPTARQLGAVGSGMGRIDA